MRDVQGRLPLNFESVWAMFQETDRKIREGFPVAVINIPYKIFASFPWRA
jgi:hypothetical protein